MPYRPCAKSGCRNLVKISGKKERFCEACKPKETLKQKQEQREYDRKRGTSSDRGYGPHWRKVRESKLKRNPICENCEISGRVTVADLVHHIDENPFNNNADNLMSLCNTCHENAHGNRFL